MIGSVKIVTFYKKKDLIIIIRPLWCDLNNFLFACGYTAPNCHLITTLWYGVWAKSVWFGVIYSWTRKREQFGVAVDDNDVFNNFLKLFFAASGFYHFY